MFAAAFQKQSVVMHPALIAESQQELLAEQILLIASKHSGTTALQQIQDT